MVNNLKSLLCFLTSHVFLSLHFPATIAQTIERYSHADAIHYSSLLFDVPHYQLIVGARDYLIRLPLDGFNDSKPKAFYVPADIDKQKLCQRKGQKKWKCHNFITVLLHFRDDRQLLVCGTKAFAPECEIRQLSSLSTIIHTENAISKSSFSPLWNTTSLVTSSGDYYFGGPLDFRGIDAAIIRSTFAVGKQQSEPPAVNHPILRTLQYDSKWINADANFVANFESESFVYFLFRESAVEYINCGKKVYSRIGRVCKNDGGGQLSSKENWTSFLKARFNCSIPGLFPFYFDEIQSAHIHLSSDGHQTIYATFATPENSIQGSAICAFRMEAVKKAFQGPFKTQEGNSNWESKSVFGATRNATFECGAVNNFSSTDNLERERLSASYQLTDLSVQAVNQQPLVIETSKRFLFISVDIVNTKYYKDVEIFFTSTTDGLIRKYVLWPSMAEACLVSEIKILRNPSDKILTMKLLKDTDSLYIGTKLEVIRLPLYSCDVFQSRDQCLDSGDPYCGWDELSLRCTSAPRRNPQTLQWTQLNSTDCPLSNPQPWCDWSECLNVNESNGNKCLCRWRKCVKEDALCSGGKQIEVSNCTRDGMWSDWGPWSTCTATCGVATRSRSRKCSSPSPAFGGRNCRGPDREVIPCLQLPPCPSNSFESRWNDWMPWEDCSVSCGGGLQRRRRTCQVGHEQACGGCDVEWRQCNLHQCPEVRQSHTTDWFVKQISDDGEVKSRIIFTCTYIPVLSNVNINYKFEERFVNSPDILNNCEDCNGHIYKWNGQKYLKFDCALHKNCSGWSQWSKWSTCNGNEVQRTRSCNKPDVCLGHYKEARFCSEKVFNGDDISNAIDKLKVSSSSFNLEVDVGYSLTQVFTFCLASFLIGIITGTVISYLYVNRNVLNPRRRHERHGLKFFSLNSVKSSSNAYVSTRDFKMSQNGHLNGHTPLSHASSSPLNLNLTPNKEATIKRNTLIRANLDSDQNF